VCDVPCLRFQPTNTVLSQCCQYTVCGMPWIRSQLTFPMLSVHSVRRAVLLFLPLSWQHLRRYSTSVHLHVSNCVIVWQRLIVQLHESYVAVDEHSNSVTSLFFISISRRYRLCWMMDYNADESLFYLLRVFRRPYFETSHLFCSSKEIFAV